jgi:hypothetical protein
MLPVLPLLTCFSLTRIRSRALLPTLRAHSCLGARDANRTLLASNRWEIRLGVILRRSQRGRLRQFVIIHS